MYQEGPTGRGLAKCRGRKHHPAPLDSRRWIFVTGLADFRSGCPPGLGLQEGCLPRIHHGAPQLPLIRQQARPKETDVFPRLMSCLARTEAQLSRQPWALCWAVEDLPRELLLKVLEVLDPDKKLEQLWTSCWDISKRRKEPTRLSKQESTLVCTEHTKKTSVFHPGPWLCKKKTSETDSLCEGRPLLPGNVRKEVSDFCNWASAFGSLNIDEEFVLKQFDVDYRKETSSDKLVMRPNQAPLLLEKSRRQNEMQEPEFFQKPDVEQRHQKPRNPCKPKRVKMRYGAWYLNTKLWKKQRAVEPLVDPKVLQNAQAENATQELQEQEQLLGDLHGTAAFKEFARSRGCRMPRFLEKMEIRKE